MKVLKKISMMIVLATATISIHGSQSSFDITQRFDQLQDWIKRNPEYAKRIYRLLERGAVSAANRIRARFYPDLPEVVDQETPFDQMSEAELAAQIAAYKEFEEKKQTDEKQQTGVSPWGHLSDEEIARQQAELEKYKAGKRGPVALPVETQQTPALLLEEEVTKEVDQQVPVAENVPPAPPIATAKPPAPPIASQPKSPIGGGKLNRGSQEKQDLMASIRAGQQLQKSEARSDQPVVAPQSASSLPLGDQLAQSLSRYRQFIEVEEEGDEDDDWL